MKNKKEKLADLIRSMISREDELINHRMGWLSAFNGLLFVALSFSWKENDAKFLSIALSILGVITSILCSTGIYASLSAQLNLLKFWERRKSKTKELVVIGLEPKIRNPFFIFLKPWFLISISFAVVWMAILLHFVD